MDQYHPCGKAKQFEELNRAVRAEEYQQAVRMAKDAGLSRLERKDYSLLLRKLGIL